MRYINAIPLTALNGEHSEMKIESVPMEFHTDSVRLIYVWRVVCGHSLLFDVFLGTMIGVELFPGQDVFNSLDTKNLVPSSDTDISFNVSAARA